MIKILSSTLIILFLISCAEMDIPKAGDKISIHKSNKEKEKEIAATLEEDREITASEFLQSENLEKIAKQTQLA